MTNYEWLVKNNALGEFIGDILKTYGNTRMKEKYGLIIDWDDEISEILVDWLQAPCRRETGARKVDCSITEDEYNKGLNDLHEGMIEAAKSSMEKITCKDCKHCYKQEGVDQDMNPCWCYRCWRTGRAMPTDPHFYCLYAEKRIEE